MFFLPCLSVQSASFSTTVPCLIVSVFHLCPTLHKLFSALPHCQIIDCLVPVEVQQFFAALICLLMRNLFMFSDFYLLALPMMALYCSSDIWSLTLSLTSDY
ncbi:hypothetical protein GOODEAATRI_019494 [Goodea atripinnis]|uniref:Uncharacterized protein n=1 Tax=Goodea atripinnis TaxID=208336 RepID=A0ABV0PQ02_9TELE